jgi:hypothetical protein
LLPFPVYGARGWGKKVFKHLHISSLQWPVFVSITYRRLKEKMPVMGVSDFTKSIGRVENGIGQLSVR